MAFVALKVLQGVFQGARKIAGKIKSRKETKIQNKIDNAFQKQGRLDSFFGEAGVSAASGGNLRNAAENILGLKPSVAGGEDAKITGKDKQLPTWLIPVGIAAAMLLFFNPFKKGR